VGFITTVMVKVLVVSVGLELLVILPSTRIVKVVVVVTKLLNQFTTFGYGKLGATVVGGVILLIEKVKSLILHELLETVNWSRAVYTFDRVEPTI
jgi:hypothetical protein